MRSTVWPIGIVFALSGCAVHETPLSAPPPPTHKPLIIPEETNNTRTAITPFCPTTLFPDLEIELPEGIPGVSDLERFEQSVIPYVEANGIDRENFFEIQERFEASYFTPWNNCTPPMRVEDIAWPLRAFKGGFGSNLRPVHPSWFQQMQEQCNFSAYGSLNQKGIALRYMDIRTLPSEKPLYNNPALPGEGFPFDLLQNSSINYGEPLFVSHTSKDGEWSYIFTNSVSGWVKTDGIRLLDDDQIGNYLIKEKLFLLQDGLPLYDETGRFVTYSRIGMVLALDSQEGENYHALRYDADQSPKHLIVPKDAARIGISKLNKGDLIRIGEQMLHNTYGWGGMFGERDCSSMIRDMLTPFGIWLPRNSSAQAKKGEVVVLEGLSNEAKLARIKEKGIPFETIIYLKGHVLLYAGTYQDNVMVLHNIWGIRTIDKKGVKGRHIVGKAVISTLELGSELEDYDPDNKLLTRVQSMNIFTKPAVLLTRGVKNLKTAKRL